MRASSLPKLNRQLAPAAAMVVKFGEPLVVNPLWRAVMGSDCRNALDLRLVPVQYVDFYPPQGGRGGWTR